MSKKEKKNITDSQREKKLSKREILLVVVWPLAVPLIVELLIRAYDNSVQTATNEILTNQMYEQYETLSGQLVDISAEIRSQNSRLDSLERDINGYRLVEFNDKISLNLDFSNGLTIEDNNAIAVGTAYSDIVAVDLITNEQLSYENLTDTRCLSCYEEDGYRIIFYGQYNEKGQWDGLCTLNAYKDNTLWYVTETNYEDGIADYYYQVFKDVVSGNNVWVESNRTVGKTNNAGYSRIYSGDNVNDIKLNDDNLEADDIIGTYDLLCSINEKLISVYYGQTQDGTYNDETGKAYYIQYLENGAVQTIYCGNFKNGEFNDSTNDAWYITKSDKTDYMYYKGEFIAGSPVNNKNSCFESSLTQERINELMKEYTGSTECVWDF